MAALMRYPASLPIELRAFVPPCEILLLGGPNGGTKGRQKGTQHLFGWVVAI
jgi:hypothetical protein